MAGVRPYVLLPAPLLGQMRGGYLYHASPDIGILPAPEKVICTCQRHYHVVYFMVYNYLLAIIAFECEN